MANFPLALSIEPSLLPYARANGFHMDHKACRVFFDRTQCIAGGLTVRSVCCVSVGRAVPGLCVPKDV